MYFTQRYNNTLDRPVYYVKSNTESNYDNLLAALLKHNNFTEYAYCICNSKTHKYCLKAINTNTGNMLSTDYTF